MRLILGSLGNPAPEQRDLGRRETAQLRLGRRHVVIGIGRRDAGEEFALVGLARNDRALRCGALANVEPQFRLALPRIRPVAEKTFVGQQRADVAVVKQALGTEHRRREKEAEGDGDQGVQGGWNVHQVDAAWG